MVVFPRMQQAIPEAYLELVLAPCRGKVAQPPGYIALASYTAGLHHVMSKDGWSASFLLLSAPLCAPGLAVLPPKVVFQVPSPHLGPIKQVKVDPRTGFDPLPLGTQGPPFRQLPLPPPKGFSRVPRYLGTGQTRIAAPSIALLACPLQACRVNSGLQQAGQECNRWRNNACLASP